LSGRTLVNDRYELHELPLARGGMGEVWLGRDIRLDRDVAVKFLRFPDGQPDDDLIRRFVRESRLTARLEHPGVPAVYDVGTHDNRPYLVMQRIRGVSIADLIAESGPLPVGWAVAIAAQTCSVLVVAHAASLIHRDLKPANLMLEPDGTVKVLDFGLAVAFDRADLSQITRTGQTLGTPAYMAPEQILAGTTSPQTDLYTLGCTLYEMLAGRHVFRGSTSFAVMSKQVDESPRSIRAKRADLPSEVDEIVLSLLAKRAEDRPASAEVVYQHLLPFAADLGPLPGALNPPKRPSPVRMYAKVLSRVYENVTADPRTAIPHQVSGPSGRHRGDPFDRTVLARVRKDAGSLVRESRHHRAAEMLLGALGPASQTLGPADPDVVELRLELANVMFEGGDYRGAASVYHRLAADVAALEGEDSRVVLRCRLQEATCHALTGDTNLALGQLTALLTDEQRVFGSHDPRVLELRRQIGLLELGAGRRDAAEHTFKALKADLTRVHGPDHPTVGQVRDLLDSIQRQPE
jgi:serine/threonine protein kinase